MQPLLDAGAAGAASPAGSGRGGRCVISMVADAPDVEQVMLGEQGRRQCPARGWSPSI
jgi:3-hydroxyisobutyrate dehydrogenase-like beta-hydroxyacid dehydrogenase